MPTCMVLGIPFSAAFEDSKSGALTWNGVVLGTADPTRIIVVATADRAGTAVSSVTVAGVSATRQVDGTHAQIWTASVPTGATGTITIVSSSATLNAIGVYALYGLNSGVPFGSGTGTTSATANVAAGGFAIGVASSAGSGTPSWTGLTSDFAVVISANEFSSASLLYSSAQTPLSVSVSGLGAGANLAVASFGP